MLKEIVDIEAELLRRGLDGTIVNCSSIRPLDENFILNEFSKYENIFTFEDGYERGGFGNEVVRFLNEKKMKININIIALDSVAIPHGSRNVLLEDYGLRGKKLIERIEGSINGEK